MTRRTRTLLYVSIGFAVAVFLVVATAYSQGADPLHPRSRHIWALSLIAALYIVVRGAIFVERVQHRRSQGYDKTKPGLSNLSFFRSEHAVDKRMAQRRARVEAARAKQESDPDETS